MVLVLRQGTGLALSISILPPGCSQKRSPAFMNTSSNTVNCYEVSEKGVRAVTVDPALYRPGELYFATLTYARIVFRKEFRAPKPRIAPRMGVASPSEVTHAHA